MRGGGELRVKVEGGKRVVKVEMEARNLRVIGVGMSGRGWKVILRWAD